MSSFQWLRRGPAIFAWCVVPALGLTSVNGTVAAQPQPTTNAPSATVSNLGFVINNCWWSYTATVTSTDSQVAEFLLNVKVDTVTGGSKSWVIQPGQSQSLLYNANVHKWSANQKNLTATLTGRYTMNGSWLPVQTKTIPVQYPPNPVATFKFEKTTAWDGTQLAKVSVGVTGPAQTRLLNGMVKAKLCTATRFPYDWKCLPIANVVGDITPAECGQTFGWVTTPIAGVNFLRVSAILARTGASFGQKTFKVYSINPVPIPKPIKPVPKAVGGG